MSQIISKPKMKPKTYLEEKYMDLNLNLGWEKPFQVRCHRTINKTFDRFDHHYCMDIKTLPIKIRQMHLIISCESFSCSQPFLKEVAVCMYTRAHTHTHVKFIHPLGFTNWKKRMHRRYDEKVKIKCWSV